jgi:hypothetical protein
MHPLPKPSCILSVDLVDGSDTCAHRSLNLKGDSVITIGRSSSDLAKQLVAGEDNFWLSSQVVSRKHATVAYKQVDDVWLPSDPDQPVLTVLQDYRLVLEDSNSTHGTYVESSGRGQRKLKADEQHIVSQGDKVQFGLKMTKEGSKFVHSTTSELSNNETEDHHPPIFEMNFVEQESPFVGAQHRSEGYCGGYGCPSDSESMDEGSSDDDRVETDDDRAMEEATPESGDEGVEASPWSSPIHRAFSPAIDIQERFATGVPATPYLIGSSQNPSFAAPMNPYPAGLPSMVGPIPGYDFTDTGRNISLENDGFELLKDAPNVFRFQPSSMVVDLTTTYPAANEQQFASSPTVNTNLTSISIPNLLNNNSYSEVGHTTTMANAGSIRDSDIDSDLAFEDESTSVPPSSPRPEVRSFMSHFQTAVPPASTGVKRNADHFDWDSESDDDSYNQSEHDSSEDDESFTSDPPSPLPGTEEEAILIAKEKEYLAKLLPEQVMADAVVQTIGSEANSNDSIAQTVEPPIARGHPEQRPAKRARTALIGAMKVGAIVIASAAATVAGLVTLPDGFFLGE